MCQVEIRCEGGDILTMNLTGRSHPEATDYWDGNWLRCTVDIQAGRFRGSVVGDIRAEELSAFSDQLARLQETLQGIAAFTTMEEWLAISVTSDHRGHMTLRCVIRDEPGTGNTLTCVLNTDQTFTRTTVAELARAVKSFPVVH